ncbi:HNH endonuclease [Paenibacillus spongiae]|uniref:HNH endonuclease n=1 Tax=Paenibacillus spongiae TaxID=2909671 RepID=A0ABY5SG05_9BACL|nr:AP2 domain-containing protein [Paenibacillus spongiae]UVI31198.1 HNH endonuclease [Paenibacillus spongiae]
MKNDYEIRGPITVIFLRRKDGTVLETLIDTDDLQSVNEFPNTWFAHWSSEVKNFYVGGMHKVGDKWKPAMLHRWVTNAPSHLVVDHINHNTLDNRQSCNLRLLTIAQNLQNRQGAQSNSKSGVRGVSWHKEKKKWDARVKLNGKYKRIGYFDDLEEAKTAIEAARAELMPFSQEALPKRRPIA